MSVNQDLAKVVIDCTAKKIRAGYAGDDIPTVSFEAQKYGLNPIEDDIIVNMDEMEQILNHTLVDELKLELSERPVVIAELPNTARVVRDQISEIMFEKFGVPGLYICPRATLSIFLSGRTSGLAVDCGYENCWAIPIHEGYTITHAVNKLEVGQKDLYSCLNEMISDKDYGIDIETIFDQYAYLAMSYEDELASLQNRAQVKPCYSQESKFSMLYTERIRCTEPLINPSLIDKQGEGLHACIHKSIMDCHVDMRRSFFGDIVLVGENSQLQGLPDRLTKGIESIGTFLHQLKVRQPFNSKNSAWEGGSFIGSISSFADDHQASIEDYFEDPFIIHRKFCT